MFCRYCGKEIKDNCRYCPKCGEEQDIRKIKKLKKLEKKIKKEKTNLEKINNSKKISLNKLIIIFLVLLLVILLIPKTIEYVSQKVYNTMQDNRIEETANKLAQIAVQDFKIRTENIKITKVLYLDDSYGLTNEILIYYTQKDEYDVPIENVAQYNNGVFYTDTQYINVPINKFTQEKISDYIYRSKYLEEKINNDDLSGYREIKVKK